MILSSLRDLAVREGLLENSDYEPKEVAWIISVSVDGRFLGLTPTVSEQKGKKPRAKMMPVPRRTGKTSNDKADFLVDKSEYVLGIEPEGKRSPEKLAARCQLFLEQVQRAAADTAYRELQAVGRFLESNAERALCTAQLEQAGYKPNDLFAFECQGRMAHECAGVPEYFSRSRREKAAATAQCLICGRDEVLVDKHPAIKVPGGSASGVALVSFNSQAHESYGWSRNENAPVCRDCADGYTTALTRLISDRYPDPRHPGQTLPRRAVRLSPNTTAVYWAEADTPLIDLFSTLFDVPDPESVEVLFRAPWKGTAPAGANHRFYCLILSGTEGRAALRGMHTGTVERVERNVRKYFEAIGSGPKGPFALWSLLRSLALLGKTKNIAPGLAGEVFLAILFGRPYPRAILAAAVQRCHAEGKVSHERAAVLRAYLKRNGKKTEEGVSLDKNNDRVGYRMGRLLAVLERLQAAAQNNPNKTIVDRYYGAASTRPGTVFPTLIRLAQHHAAKLKSAGYYQVLMGKALEGVPGFPPSLSLEEQGLFALGYYHQRQEFYKKKATEEVPENDGEQETGASA